MTIIHRTGMARVCLLAFSVLLLLIVSFAPAFTGQVQQAASAGAQAEEPGCPGQRMSEVQATGVYRNRPVEDVVINGKPWGGAYWEAGMRSYWHCHAGGQLMLMWDGEGRIQKRGQRVRTLVRGESDIVAAWEEHWHGAAAHTDAQYLQQSIQPGGVFWMEEVSPDDYRGNDIGMNSRADFLRTGVRERTDTR